MKDLIETLEEYANGFTSVLAPSEEEVKELLEHLYNQDKEIEDIRSKWYDDSEKYLLEIKRLNNIINEYETRFKIIKEIVEDNILEELNSLEYSMMMSTISSVCDGKPGFLKLGVDKK